MSRYFGGLQQTHVRCRFADQAMCYYSIGSKTMKCWRRVFWRLHDHAIINAYALYKANSQRTIKRQKDFRMELAYSLTVQAVQLRRQPGCTHTTALSRLTGKHYIYRSSNLKRCRVCPYKKNTSWGTIK